MILRLQLWGKEWARDNLFNVGILAGRVNQRIHKNSTVLYKSQTVFYGHTVQSHLYEVLFIYLFLALLLGTWDLSSPDGDLENLRPLHWKRARVLTSRPPGKPLKETKTLTNFLYPVLLSLSVFGPKCPVPTS